MSNLEMKKQLEAMPERDRKVWELHRKATNALGFAEQMAAQGSENSQCKYEKQADAASAELWELLRSPDVSSGEQDGVADRRPVCGSTSKVVEGKPEIYECGSCYHAWTKAERQAGVEGLRKALQAIEQGRGACEQQHCADVAMKALAVSRSPAPTEERLFEKGERVQVNHPRYHGKGIVQYDSGPRVVS